MGQPLNKIEGRVFRTLICPILFSPDGQGIAFLGHWLEDNLEEHRKCKMIELLYFSTGPDQHRSYLVINGGKWKITFLEKKGNGRTSPIPDFYGVVHHPTPRKSGDI
eukprot:scaffold9188_cov112-Cylindrotheca_fusiformis.AAC.1